MAHRVLFLEADPDLREYISGVLADEGFDMLPVSDLPPTLAQVRALAPDLICLDINMPERKGLALYRALRMDETLKRLPIIVMSNLEEADSFMEGGFKAFVGTESLPKPDGYIERPVLIAALKVMITRLLSGETFPTGNGA